MSFNVERLVQLLGAEISKNSELRLYLTPFYESLSQNGDLLREVKDDVWDEVKRLIDKRDEDGAIKAIMKGLSTRELIAQIVTATKGIEEEVDEKQRRWKLAESVAISLIDFGGKMLMNYLMEKDGK